MSCQTSLKPVREFIQLINHLRLCCSVMWPWSTACRLSVSLLLYFSFFQQLLRPAKLFVTLQLSANKSSGLRPAFSHTLSWPGSRFWLSLSSLSACMSSSSTLCLPLPSSLSFQLFLFFTTHNHISNITSFSSFLSFLSRPVPRVNQSGQHTCCNSRTLDRKTTKHVIQTINNYTALDTNSSFRGTCAL